MGFGVFVLRIQRPMHIKKMTNNFITCLMLIVTKRIKIQRFRFNENGDYTTSMPSGHLLICNVKRMRWLGQMICFEKFRRAVVIGCPYSSRIPNRIGI